MSGKEEEGSIGVNPGWVGDVATSPDLGLRRSWTGRETLLYLIMYRKYVRKW